MLLQTYKIAQFSKRQAFKPARMSLDICNTVWPEEWLIQKNSINTTLQIEVTAIEVQLTMLFSPLLWQHPVPLAALPQQFESCGDKKTVLRKMARFPENGAEFIPFWENSLSPLSSWHLSSKLESQLAQHYLARKPGYHSCDPHSTSLIIFIFFLISVILY